MNQPLRIKSISLCIGVLLSILPNIILAQKKPAFEKYAMYSDRGSDVSNSYYVIESNKPLPTSVKIIRRIDENNSIALLSFKEAQALQSSYKIAAANNSWKLSPALENKINSGDYRSNVSLQFILVALSIDDLTIKLGQLKSSLSIEKIDRNSHSIKIKCTYAFLKEHLLSMTDIIFVDLFIKPHSEISIIGYDRTKHGINALDYQIPSANGKNIVVGIKEQKMDAEDIDIKNRVVASSLAAPNVQMHATTMASIIGGAGNSFYDGRGIANACFFYPSSFDNLFADDSVILTANKVSVQNHSYGTVPQQFYGAEAMSYDNHSFFHKNFVHVFSSGNRGGSVASDGKYAGLSGFANITGNFKMAKNIITVGAMDNSGNIAVESSAGPLYDGRLAPQIFAHGPNGTSDAAAMVSGTIGVMQQIYQDSNSQQLPPASLIKAILFNTADDIFKTGITYKTGFGFLNSYEAVKAIQQKQYDGSTLIANQSWTKNISVPINAYQIKVTLSWTDTTASVNNNKAIANDLDLELIDVNTATVYKPWVLNVAANTDSLKKQATRKRDSLNTSEQISISLPTAGVYQIKVTATNVVSTAVPFHIAYKIDTLNTFQFLSPQHNSDVNRSETETASVKWKTFIADSNQTGKLSISYDRGNRWILLQQLKIYLNEYRWTIKDTNSTALFRMETNFGNFFSKEFVISRVIRPRVDFLCTDSFGLSWNKHVYANGYKIYALVDSPYLKPLMTITDTFKTFNRSLFPYKVYAVEPILSNNLPASRSVAMNIELQAINCFYKALNYNLRDNNSLSLVLELSSTNYVDSVSFERVSPQGLLIQQYGAQKTNGSSNYLQAVNNLPIGTIYFRARIRLKNGAIIYTDIISVTTPGLRQILFYPNPVVRTQSLNYILQQGLPGDCRLQFFDITGRLLKDYKSLPDKLDLIGFPTGVIIYQLSKPEGKMIERGKIIIGR